MKKYLLIIGAVILAGLGWLFSAKPQPPFAGATPQPSIYFAEIDSNGSVLRVIVATQSVIDSGQFGDPKNWIATYENGTRKNYAGIGYKYDKSLDAFIPPKPRPDATLDSQKGQWIIPTPLTSVIKSSVASK